LNTEATKKVEDVEVVRGRILELEKEVSISLLSSYSVHKRHRRNIRIR